DEAHDVDALGATIQGVQPFGEGFPIPVHTRFHGGQGNGFHPLHGQHQTLLLFRMSRGETKTAVADSDGSYTVPA
ncbi:hypothetical protein DF186_23265, partial [Enterococcus hirae]